MGKMVRKQMYIEPVQEARLKRAAAEQGSSEAEIIRTAVDLVLSKPADAHADSQAWESELAFIRERSRIPLPSGGRTWKREDAYDG